ncbi:MAG TPA: SAM-dependent methyltransferase [Streptosporangiaceae bacterium]|nr:SAM-dependent methyltransferase [Streptosporangiaceae bacterium]
MPDADVVPEGVDPTRPSPARLYDYYLGGTHNYEADRQAAEQIRRSMPDLADAAWANRGFHGRAAVWMAASQGIRQFLDLGSGLPTQNNTHQAVRRVAPDARVVYVDVDPIVAAHGAPLLAADGSTALITADVRDPDAILDHPELRRLIDFSQPVGVLMTAVVHFVADGSDPWSLVRRYMTATAPGSYLALSHLTHDRVPPQITEAGLEVYQRTASNIYARSHDEVTRFFDGLELAPAQPGGERAITFVGLWGAEDVAAADSDGSRHFYCGVARRP